MPNSQIKAIHAAIEAFIKAAEKMYQSCANGRDRWDENGRVIDYSKIGGKARDDAREEREEIHESLKKLEAKIVGPIDGGALDAVDGFRGDRPGKFAFALRLDLRKSADKLGGMFDTFDDSWERLGAIKAIKTKFLGHLNTVSAARAIKPALPTADDKADELPPGTTGHGGDQAEINSPFTPDEKDIWILEVYANRRIYLTQENIETALNNGNGDHRLSVRTIGDRLKKLRKNRLISHPHGKKRKDKITTIGLNFMDKTHTEAAAK
jgi:hypothetical protein